ncbi:MAG TPA: hypothetical protein VIS07_00485 [Candidatus Binatia bacterium]
MTTAQPTASVAAPTPTPSDIRDIRGPLPIPIAWLLPALVLVGLLLALALAMLARRWWQRRKRPAPPRPADVVALERLEAARALLDPAHAREFCFAVSEAVRLYIEDRFAVLAARRTTEEFLADLVRAPAPGLASHARLLDDFLRRSDLVKFARAPLAREEMEAMLASATRFVHDTRPGVEAAA